MDLSFLCSMWAMLQHTPWAEIMTDNQKWPVSLIPEPLSTSCLKVVHTGEDDFYQHRQLHKFWKVMAPPSPFQYRVVPNGTEQIGGKSYTFR